MSGALKKLKPLKCSCCGSPTTGRQWWNRDAGYGLCKRCIEFCSKGETPESMRECYGERGIHYDIEGAEA